MRCSFQILIHFHLIIFPFGKPQPSRFSLFLGCRCWKIVILIASVKKWAVCNIIFNLSNTWVCLGKKITNVALSICTQKYNFNNVIIFKYNSNRDLVFCKNEFKEKQTRCSNLLKPKFALDVHSGHILLELFNYLCHLEGDYFHSPAKKLIFQTHWKFLLQK